MKKKFLCLQGNGELALLFAPSLEKAEMTALPQAPHRGFATGSHFGNSVPKIPCALQNFPYLGKWPRLCLHLILISETILSHYPSDHVPVVFLLIMPKRL